MTKFNKKKAYHGSNNVMLGNLQGQTAETDYFYFFCPKCPDKHILRILDYHHHGPEEADPPYNDETTEKAKRAFTFVFHLHCERCKFNDFVKISNTGWQGGTYDTIMRRF